MGEVVGKSPLLTYNRSFASLKSAYYKCQITKQICTCFSGEYSWMCHLVCHLTCFLMASRSLSRTKSSLSCTLVSLVLLGSENNWKKLSCGSKLLSVWTNSMYLLISDKTGTNSGFETQHTTPCSDSIFIQLSHIIHLADSVTYVLTSLSQISLGRKMSERRQSLFLYPW